MITLFHRINQGDEQLVSADREENTN